MRGYPNTRCKPGKEIVSSEECKSAAVSLGLRFNDFDDYHPMDIDVNYEDYPGGCFWYSHEYSRYDYLHFNKGCGTAEYYSGPICFKGIDIIPRNNCIYSFKK